jgi:flagellar biosynthesis GTPase FlhF
MSAITALTARLSKLEDELKTLRAQTPLEVFTAALKTASPEDKEAWFNACNEVAASLTSPAEPSSKKTKTASNPRGPSEWNVFVNATWVEMAAAKGVFQEEGQDDKAFKKAAAAVGVTYQGALKEASARKAALEGAEPKKKVKKAEKAEKEPSLSLAQIKEKVANTKTTSSALQGGGAQTPEPEESKESEESEDDKVRREAIEAGLTEMTLHGCVVFFDPETKNVYSYPSMDHIGEFVNDTFVSA